MEHDDAGRRRARPAEATASWPTCGASARARRCRRWARAGPASSARRAACAAGISGVSDNGMPVDRPTNTTASRVGREQFYAIACDPRRSVAVEACAGAGKTWMLVSRILRALLAGAQPHEILAITFTKKAAGEMRQRLHEWLAAVRAAPRRASWREALRGARRRPQADAAHARGAAQACTQRCWPAGRPVQIRTFHSWFAALLRSAPLAVLQELGLPARYELLEDDKEAVARVWRRFHARGRAPTPAARADFEASVAAHGRFNTLKALAGGAGTSGWSSAWPTRTAWWRRRCSPSARCSRSSPACEQPEQLLQQACGARSRCLARPRVPGPRSRADLLGQGPRAGARRVTAGDVRRAWLRRLLTEEAGAAQVQRQAGRHRAVRAAQDLAQRLCRRRAASTRPGCTTSAWRGWRACCWPSFAALKREQRLGRHERRRARGAGAAVRPGAVRLGAGAAGPARAPPADRRIPGHQPAAVAGAARLAFQLCGRGRRGRPSVFIVGDPKQSIYRFRRAEPQVFRAAQDFIARELQGDRLSCDHTHRNAPAVLAAVNTVMGAGAGARGSTTDFRAAHHRSRRARGRGAARCRPMPAADARGRRPTRRTHWAWRDSLTVPRELPEEKLVTLECRQAAAWIAAAAALAAWRRPSVMVLARRRDRLAAMEDELRALHIPAQQPEKTDLCEAPEVQDLAALLDVLVSPAPRPVAGPRAEVAAVRLRRRRAGARWRCARAQRRRTGRRAPGSSCCRRARTCPSRWRAIAGRSCARWQRWVQALPPHDALQAIYDEGDVLARFARRAPAPLRAAVLANLQALLGAALQVDGGRYAHALCVRARAEGRRHPRPRRGRGRRGAPAHGARRQGPGSAAGAAAGHRRPRRRAPRPWACCASGRARRRRRGASPSSPARPGRRPATRRRWAWSRRPAPARGTQCACTSR